MLLKGGVRLSAYAALLSLYIFVLESEEKQMKKKKKQNIPPPPKTPKTTWEISLTGEKLGF